MISPDLLAEIRIGNEIAFGVNHAWEFGGFQFSKIAKITPKSGIIETECGHRFNSDGDEIKSKVSNYPRYRLISAEKALEIKARIETQRNLDRQVRDLQEAISRHRTGKGQYHVNSKTLQMIVELTAQLQQPQDESNVEV